MFLGFVAVVRNLHMQKSRTVPAYADRDTSSPINMGGHFMACDAFVFSVDISLREFDHRVLFTKAGNMQENLAAEHLNLLVEPA